MSAQTPIEEFESLLSSSSILFAVFYRGHWCPFCQGYLRTLQGLTPDIESLGGKIVVITSEPAEFLPKMRTASTYSGLAIVDPRNTLVTLVKERYDLDIAITEKKGYEHGMAQPGFVVVRGGMKSEITGKKDTVFEKWAIVPSTMNLGGAKDRPELSQVWDNVKAEIEGKEIVHKDYKMATFVGTFCGIIYRRLFG